MQTVAEELTTKTQEYWNLSSMWNNRILATTSTGDAIELCSTLIQQTNLNRPLSYRVEGLLDEIILGESIKQNQESQIVPFKSKAKA